MNHPDTTPLLLKAQQALTEAIMRARFEFKGVETLLTQDIEDAFIAITEALEQVQGYQEECRRAKMLKTINALPRGSALCDHWAYLFLDDDMDLPAKLCVDILAWRTRSQADEDARWNDLSDLLHVIEGLPSVAALNQIGDIDHENGRGWTYEVTLA
jgi:hypothetical protein